MLEEFVKLLDNPTFGTARDISVGTGNTVWVNLARGVIPAIAVNDINGENVMVGWSEKDNTYYAISPHNAIELNSETLEIDRSRIPGAIEEVELFYIVVLDPPNRISEEIVNISLPIPNYRHFNSFLYAQEDSEVIAFRSVANQDLTVYRYIDSTFSQNTITNWLFVLSVNTSELTFFSGGEIIVLSSPLSANDFIGGIEAMIFDETGSNIGDNLDATLSYTGDPVNTYSYDVTDTVGGDRTEFIDIIEFDQGALASFNETFKDFGLQSGFGRNLAYFSWVLSDDGNYAVDQVIQVGNAFFVQSLKQDRIQGVWTKDFSYSSVAGIYPDYNYARFNERQGDILIDIINNTFVGGTATGNLITRITADFTVTNRESFDTAQYAGKVDLISKTLDFSPTQANNYSDEEILIVNCVTDKDLDHRQQTGNLFIATALTMGVSVNWTLTKNYSHVSSFSDNFTFGSLVVPLNYNWSTSLSYSDTFSFSAQSVQTSEPVDLTPTFPDASNQLFIFQAEPNTVSFEIDAVWDFPQTTNSTQPIDKSFTLTKVMAASKTDIFYYHASYNCDASYTVNFTSRPVADNDGQFNVVDDSQYVQPRLRYASFQDVGFNPMKAIADNGSFNLDLSRLFFSELDRETEIREIGLVEVDFNQRDSAFSKTKALSVTNLNFTVQLRYFDGTSGVTINESNTLYGDYSSSNTTLNSTTITINEAKLFGLKGGARDRFLTSYDLSETITYTPSITLTSSLVEGSSTPYINLNNFVGRTFLVFYGPTRILYTATLNTFTPLNPQSETNLTLTIEDAIELRTNAFLTSGIDSILITQENLAAAFANIPEIDRRLSLSGSNMFLTYFTNPGEVEDQQYIHQFKIASGNILYTAETLADINSSVDNDDPYVAKQYVNKI